MGKLMCCATMFAGKVAKAGFELPLAWPEPSYNTQLPSGPVRMNEQRPRILNSIPVPIHVKGNNWKSSAKWIVVLELNRNQLRHSTAGDYNVEGTVFKLVSWVINHQGCLMSTSQSNLVL
jgi:hypothetical protein